MAGGASEDDDLISGINVTPLVDIVLVLLIIFMVTATDIVKAQIGVDLPRAASGQAEVKETLTFRVKPDGTYMLDAQVMTLEEIASKARASVTSDPDVRAVVAADKDVPYGRVIDLIDTIKVNGIEKFALNIQRKPRPSLP